jgi:hypothetical protein
VSAGSGPTGSGTPGSALPDPDDPATDAVVARHVATLPPWAARWDARILAGRERLRRRSPGAYRWLLASLVVGYLAADAAVPRRRVRPLTAVLVAMTLVDSVATYVWVTRAVAVEGNPIVDGVMGVLGDGPALAVRTVLSGLLLVALAWLATRHWEARGGLAVAAVALTGVTAVHLYGLVLVLTGTV